MVLLKAKIGKHLFYSDQTYCTQNYQKASEYDQEIPQSHTSNEPTDAFLDWHQSTKYI